ncbi:MAG TPA: hypothetical protein GX019_07640, partial [Firmicutes bacterium]|nr:hypothetical protein [Bacillota bacterium]
FLSTYYHEEFNLEPKTQYWEWSESVFRAEDELDQKVQLRMQELLQMQE